MVQSVTPDRRPLVPNDTCWTLMMEALASLNKNHLSPWLSDV